jgi:uncharacterized membrane protein
MQVQEVVLVVAGVLTGLLAGVFYCFQVAIVPGLRRLPAAQQLAAMQHINSAIKNPVFMLSFLGPSILLPIATLQHNGQPEFLPLLLAAILHIIGANGVTIGGNLPLNDKLDQVDTGTVPSAEAERIRIDFQGPGSRWMQFHAVRTIASTLATALVFWACLM